MIRTNNPCPGTIDGLKCPFNTHQDKTCKIHKLCLATFNKPLPPKVSWIEKSNIVCHICGIKQNIIRYTCKKHYYCEGCLVEALQFEDCPVCISMEDYVSN